MTAHDHIRAGTRRLGRRDRTSPIDATPAPTVGEMLSVARQGKGVDLFRAERDTKIRARYLAALENGEYDELPGAVYTKGFLRNYALYLELDPDDMLARWREQAHGGRRTLERPVVAAPPRPIVVPKAGFTITRGLFGYAFLTLAVLAFAGYLVLQVVRFMQTSPVAVDGPRLRELPAATETTTLTGTSAGGATVVVTGGGELHRTATADAAGRWSVDVPLAEGRNDFAVMARDPVTSRDSDPIDLIIMVGKPIAATPSATPRERVPTLLTLTAPAEGSLSNDGRIVVSGTTDAASVTITATPIGAVGASPAASPGTPLTRDVEVPRTRAFSANLDLTPGRWRIGVSATRSGGPGSSQQRTVEVRADGVSVVVTARGGSAWIQVTVDGELVSGHRAGVVLRSGQSRSFRAARIVKVRTGDAGRTAFTVDGRDLGPLGRVGAVDTWIFEVGNEPRRVR